MTRKVISGDVTGLSYRFKDDLSQDGGVATTPWYALEPNTYSDFGGEVTTVTRNPISRSRQRKKGVVTDFDASGGFNHDMTQHQLTRLLQPFFYANAFEKATTAPLNSASIPVTAVTTGPNVYAVDNSPSLGFAVNQLVLASGFTNGGNNGVKFISVAGAASLTTTTAGEVAEAAPPAAARLDAIGYRFPVGDLAIDAQTDRIVLTSATITMTGLGLHPGEWIFIGGDATVNQFASNTPGYARVSLDHPITATTITLDKSTWTPADSDGATKLIDIYYGTFIRNMTEAEIEAAGDVPRFFPDLERSLGSDGVGIQSGILMDAFANALTYTQPLAGKITFDLSFVSLDEVFRTGTEGLLAGTRVPALGEGAFNTSTCLFRAKMTLLDPLTLNPSALFAYVQSIELTIENNVSAVKAQGDVGGIDTIEGDFQVGGSATVYFSTVAAVSAVRDYSDVSFDAILAKSNAGYAFDVPLLGLGNGRLNVEKDSPITVPLGIGAFENAAGYTASYTNWRYLPTVAMPVT